MIHVKAINIIQSICVHTSIEHDEHHKSKSSMSQLSDLTFPESMTVPKLIFFFNKTKYEMQTLPFRSNNHTV